VTQAVGLNRPALIGHSRGAATIALAAAHFPALPRCIVLEDPAWREPPGDETAEQAAQRRAQGRAYVDDWREWVRGLQAGPREAGLAQIRARSPKWSEIDQNLSLDARRQVEIELFDYYPTGRMEWRSVLPRIECPVLLLTGDDAARGVVVAPDEAREAAGLCRRGRWVQIQGAGHAVRYDQFERYLAAVLPFLRECA
jgi:pimeloyl-ACP methyl ester carboxylesterase